MVVDSYIPNDTHMTPSEGRVQVVYVLYELTQKTCIVHAAVKMLNVFTRLTHCIY